MRRIHCRAEVNRLDVSVGRNPTLERLKSRLHGEHVATRRLTVAVPTLGEEVCEHTIHAVLAIGDSSASTAEDLGPAVVASIGATEEILELDLGVWAVLVAGPVAIRPTRFAWRSGGELIGRVVGNTGLATTRFGDLRNWVVCSMDEDGIDLGGSERDGGWGSGDGVHNDPRNWSLGDQLGLGRPERNLA